MINKFAILPFIHVFVYEENVWGCVKKQKEDIEVFCLNDRQNNKKQWSSILLALNRTTILKSVAPSKYAITWLKHIWIWAVLWKLWAVLYLMIYTDNSNDDDELYISISFIHQNQKVMMFLLWVSHVISMLPTNMTDYFWFVCRSTSPSTPIHNIIQRKYYAKLSQEKKCRSITYVSSLLILLLLLHTFQHQI